MSMERYWTSSFSGTVTHRRQRHFLNVCWMNMASRKQSALISWHVTQPPSETFQG